MIKRYNCFMILVMNKKNGVGCTSLTYNLGRLFELPIYVKEDSFMISDDYKELFPTVSKITPSKKGGIFDIGSDYKKAYVKKLIIDYAKVIVIPMELGHESIIGTIETIKHIRAIDEARPNPNGFNLQTPIVLVLNKLDKQDSDKDFRHKEALLLKLEEAGFNYNGVRIVMTYLRHSYGVFADIENGQYFLDKFLKETMVEDKEINHKNIDNFEYKKFLHFVFRSLSKTDYENDNIYIQDKDMVEFRNKFKKRYYDKMCGVANCNDINSIQWKGIENFCNKMIHKTNVYQEDKLIKDLAFISHTIYEYIIERDENNRINSDIDFMYDYR